MKASPWTERPLPQPLQDELGSWSWELRRSADLTTSRIQLREYLLGAAVPDDDVERLLLAYEELASNGLRHGQPPVRAAVTAARSGWLIDVTDTAIYNTPVPAVDRDPALGGLGLYLIQRLCAAYGWTVKNRRKHVWALIETAEAS